MAFRPVVLREELKYLRREGNRSVRARRRRRSALRAGALVVVWTAALVSAAAASAAGLRWVLGQGRFPLRQVVVGGLTQAPPAEVADLLRPLMGRNLLALDLQEVEAKVRQHPWVGSSGEVRVRRRLPGTLVVTVRERVAAGAALVDGAVHLVDERGLPIDRFGPRYAGHDYPIITGLEAAPEPSASDQARERRRRALGAGAAVTRALARQVPAFYAQVSEIDVSDPAMIALRLEGEVYEVRLSPEDCLKNLDRFFALRDRIEDPEGAGIEYVDLRWKDRVAVMPAVASAEQRKELEAMLKGGER